MLNFNLGIAYIKQLLYLYSTFKTNDMKTNIEYGIGYTSDYKKSAKVQMSFFNTSIGHFTKVIAVMIDGEWITDKAICNLYNH